MRVYMSTDMEGISGVNRGEYADFGHRLYAEARQLQLNDVNAAITGAFDGGADYVLVSDTHGSGPNLQHLLVDERADFCYSAPGNLFPGLDDSFDALFIVGQHAMAGSGGFLDHTQCPETWYEYRINGVPYGETGQAAAIAGYYDVPLVFLSGDDFGCAEAERQFPGVRTVTVKWTVTRNRARCMHPKKAAALIRAGAAESLASVAKLKPWKIPPPVTVELLTCRSDLADNLAVHDGVERVGPRHVRKVVQSQKDILRF
ncbi:MAG: M55 family metallopeptidase [Planctomycetes bacterium]|nr:M55 family metallopeptidase [Planctomycetota bacterium]